MSSETCISNLPSTLVLEILSRLPIKTILSCQVVCSSWLELLLSQEFTKLHYKKSSKSLIINKNHDHHLKLIQTLDDPNDQAILFDYSHIDTYNRFSVFGSCNGMLLLSNFSVLVVCNPILREYIILPKDEDSYPTQVGHGFGYCVEDEEFKVMRIIDEQKVCFESDSFFTHKYKWQVITLGDEPCWRTVENVEYSFGYLAGGVQLEGNVHWIVVNEEQYGMIVYVFDLKTELFSSFSCPRHVGIISVLEGCLCLTNKALNYDLEIWVMKEYGVSSSWEKMFVISQPDESIDSFFACRYICLLERFEDGKLLFLWDEYGLFLYDTKEKTYTDYFGRDNCFEVGDYTSWMHAMVYVPSFASLQNIVKSNFDVKKL